MPRFVVALGEIPQLSYEPRAHSKRGNTQFIHESGDRGFGKAKSNNRPGLAADPKTGRPLIVPMKSPVKLSGKRGLVG